MTFCEYAEASKEANASLEVERLKIATFTNFSSFWSKYARPRRAEDWRSGREANQLQL